MKIRFIEDKDLAGYGRVKAGETCSDVSRRLRRGIASADKQHYIDNGIAVEVKAKSQPPKDTKEV